MNVKVKWNEKKKCMNNSMWSTKNWITLKSSPWLKLKLLKALWPLAYPDEIPNKAQTSSQTNLW